MIRQSTCSRSLQVRPVCRDMRPAVPRRLHSTPLCTLFLTVACGRLTRGAALRKENDARRREAEDMTKLLDLLATGSVVTEEKQHLQELREMINRLSPHRTPTITLKDTVIRDKPTDSVSGRTTPPSLLWRSSRFFLCMRLHWTTPIVVALHTDTDTHTHTHTVPVRVGCARVLC